MGILYTWVHSQPTTREVYQKPMQGKGTGHMNRKTMRIKTNLDSRPSDHTATTCYNLLGNEKCLKNGNDEER